MKLPLSLELVEPEEPAALSGLSRFVAGVPAHLSYDGRMKDMPNLDLVRSIAVLLVVVEHLLLYAGIFRLGYWQVAWMGFLGVYIFFVHTCLVLMWSLERNSDVLGFYVRRFFRIYPLAVFTVLITVLFRIPISVNVRHLPDPQAPFFFTMPDARSLIEHLLLVQNLDAGNWIVGVLWSLPYEVQMYLVLPALYFFVRKRRSWQSAVKALLVLWVGACLFARLVAPHAMSIPTCVPYFLPGIMAYAGFKIWRARFGAWLLPVMLIVLLFAFEVRPSVEMGWGPCLAIGLSLPFFKQIRSRWLMHSTYVIAKYSYGIYLFHSISIWLALGVLHGRGWPIQALAFVASLALGVFAAYHLLEKPMIDLGSRMAKRMARQAQELKPIPL